MCHANQVVTAVAHDGAIGRPAAHEQRTANHRDGRGRRASRTAAAAAVRGSQTVVDREDSQPQRDADGPPPDQLLREDRLIELCQPEGDAHRQLRDLQQRFVLVRALHKDFAMKVQSAFRLLTLIGTIEGVGAAKDPTLWQRVATKTVLAWIGALIAMRAVWAHAYT